MNNNVSILINTCDKYHDVLPLFFSAFKEHWSGCNYPINLNSEYEKYECSGLKLISHTVLNNEKTNWGYRFKKALDKIKSDYIITLFDDYVLESDVDVDFINQSIQKLESNVNIGAIYLFPILKNQIQNEVNNDKFIIISNSVPYRINTSPAIWRKSFLKELISEKDDPWSWEAFAHLKEFAKSKEILSISQDMLPAYNYCASVGGAIYRGKWVLSVVDPKLQKYNIKLDLNKRGVYSKNFIQQRSLLWKIKFLLSGFRIAGLKIVYFLIKNYRKL